VPARFLLPTETRASRIYLTIFSSDSNLRRYALLFRVQRIPHFHSNESALHLTAGNVSPFLIPKKEKISAIGFSQSQRSTTL
jgi:hypothetical protein